MRILVVSPVYPPYKGGMGAVAAQEVALLRDAGHDVRVVTPKYRDRASDDQDGVLALVPRFSWGNGAILSPFSLWREIKKSDAVMLHYPFFGSAFTVACCARILRKHLVTFFHMRARATHRFSFLRALFFIHRMLEEPLVKRFSHEVCVSSEDYAHTFHLPKEKTHIVPFGVDTDRFSPGRDDAFRAMYGALVTDRIALFVGGMDRAHAFKGVSILLHAFACIKKDGWRLWLVGSGDMRGIYEQLARDLRITDAVSFLGGVPFADLPRVYRAADFHVLPSISGAEAYGLVTCEAGASGIPSIVSNLPGVRSLVVSQESGLHVQPGDVTSLAHALEYLFTHDKDGDAFGKAAREKMCKDASFLSEQRALLAAFEEGKRTV